jgi:hypothetical protein
MFEKTETIFHRSLIRPAQRAGRYYLCYWMIGVVRSLGVEPKFPASQASVLSIERRAQFLMQLEHSPQSVA